MPTSVRDCFAAAGLTRDGAVPWGKKPPTSESGVYVVALTESEEAASALMTSAPLAEPAFEAWLEVCPDLTMDGGRPTVEMLRDRIQSSWIAHETILYVGLATTLSSRLGAYYRTPIGARRPHSGGYFLKLLSNLDELWVHYARCSDPAEAEDRMIGRFCEGIPQATMKALRDPDHPFPFANLEWPRGTRKAHGLRGAREAYSRRTEVVHVLPTSHTRLTPNSAAATTGAYRTQRVTAADLERGQIRIPAAGAAPTKSLFPTAKASVEVNLRGTRIRASWDPRMGPDKERSGVLRIGSVLPQLVGEDQTLLVAAGDNGLRID